MVRRPLVSKRTDTLFPITTHVRSMRRSGRVWAMDLGGRLAFREWCGSRGPVNLREELSVFSSLFLPLSAVAYPVGPQRRMAEKPDIDHSAQLSRKARVN